MILRSLRFSGFMCHHDTFVEFPERGLVLVVGPNGAGKSALVEGVASALWGSSVRGTSPWPVGGGSVEVVTELVTAKRSRSEAGRTTLSWSCNGQPSPAYETTTKAQEALEALVGPFDLWRRSLVLVSGEGAHFTGAADLERKRFLESVLGLERIDQGYRLAAAEVSAASSAVTEARVAVATAVGHLQVAQAKRELLEQVCPEPSGGDVASLRLQVSRLNTAQELASKRLPEAQAEVDRLNTSSSLAAAKVRQARAGVAAAERNACPTCLRPLPEAQQAADQEAAQKELVAAQEEAAQLGEALADARAFLLDLVQIAGETRGQLHTRTMQLREAERAEQMRASLASQVQKALEVQEACEASAVAANVALELARAEEAEAGAVVQVLGPRGVRGSLLAQSLGALEVLIHGWLAQLVDGCTVRLGLQGEKISLLVEGAGGGHGYRGASAGERRRIDFAVTLALADMVSASRGVSQGTLFADEVFDTLDQESVERAGRVLERLAEDRCVVVISHSPEVAESLRYTALWRVEGGVVSLGK